MSSGTRLLLMVRVAIPLLLWVAHLFLPVLDRTDPKPGWVQIYLVFFPVGWLLLISHALFLSAVGLSAFRCWVAALCLMIGAAALLLLCRPGPISYAGMQALWAAYVAVLLSAAAGLALGRRSDRRTRR